jgi:hypothetical protein
VVKASALFFHKLDLQARSLEERQLVPFAGWFTRRRWYLIVLFVARLGVAWEYLVALCWSVSSVFVLWVVSVHLAYDPCVIVCFEWFICRLRSLCGFVRKLL